jgi:hypothetical protein
VWRRHPVTAVLGSELRPERGVLTREERDLAASVGQLARQIGKGAAQALRTLGVSQRLRGALDQCVSAAV